MRLNKGDTVHLSGGTFTAPQTGVYNVSGNSATFIYTTYDDRETWDGQQWLKHFQELEQYPEAAKALKLYNSKLYKVLK